MALSDVDWCNSALIKIGVGTITALSDASKQARLCLAQYEKCRDDLLAMHPWKFALARVQLAASATPPAFDYLYQFQLPNDCLRVLSTSFLDDTRFTVEGRFLLTDYSDVSIQYIKKITDPTQFPADFSEALSSKLAADISYSLVQSVTLRDQLMKEAKERIAYARTTSAQQGTGARVYADHWFNERF